jgi:hypothetical protein
MKADQMKNTETEHATSWCTGRMHKLFNKEN